MKRILILALVASFVLSAGLVSAKEMSFVGQFEHALQWNDNTNFLDSEGDNASEDDFLAQQRVRMYFQYVDSETLRGVVGFEIDTVWGSPNATATKGTGGGAVSGLGGDATNVEVKHAYTDFSAGGIAFRVGLQGLSWPSAVAGSPIFANDLAGIVGTYKFNDNFALTGGWVRLWDRQTADAAFSSANDEVDAFTLIAPITMDGWSLTPYLIYAQMGENASAAGTNPVSSLQAVNGTALYDSLDIWWAGAAFSVTMFDPFVFGADLIYGTVDGSNNSANDMEGWFFSAILTYKMDMFTPSIAVLYGTGEDDDPTDGSEVMPTLAMGGATNGGFALTHFGFDGAAWTETGGLLGGRTDYAGVALILDNISFIENLTHKLTIAYLAGTSDADLVKKYHTAANPLAQAPVLTDEDSAWEINFDSTYQMYENLTLAGRFGYINVDLDDEVWNAALGTAKDKIEDAYNFALVLRYNF